MRVAYLVGGFPVLSETFVINQIAGMVQRGVEVQILATARRMPKPARLPEMVERHRLMEHVISIGPPKNFLLRLVRILWRLAAGGWRHPRVVLRALNVSRYGKNAATLALLYSALVLLRSGRPPPDVIHVQFGAYAPLALKLLEIGALQGKIISAFRGYDATKYLQANPHAYDTLFRVGRRFLPVSAALAAKIIAAGCDPARVQVHHSGIDLARIPYRDTVRAADEPTALLMVGRLVEKKGFDHALRAIAQVIASGRRVTATLIGDGPLRSELQQLIRTLGLDDQVRMVGSRPHAEVIAAMTRAHLLMAPSVTSADGDEEGIPNTLKEAMALGLPVLATRHAGIPELVEDGVSGYLVPERDSDALAARLMQLVDHPQAWVAMGRAGRARIESAFDIDRLNDELLALYRELASSG